MPQYCAGFLFVHKAHKKNYIASDTFGLGVTRDTGKKTRARVTIYYMPLDKTCIYYSDEMKKTGNLDLGANARRFETPNQ